MNNVNGFEIIAQFVLLLIRRKWFIFWMTTVPTIFAIVLVLVAKSSYKSEALLKPPAGEKAPSIDALLKDAGGVGGALLGSFLGGVETGENDCMAILRSAQFADIVIRRFALDSVYKFTKKKKYFPADVIKYFQRKAKFELTEESHIKISMVDESPEKAQEIVTYMILVLDSLYSDIQRTATRQRLKYIDQRLLLAESEMKLMEDTLVLFQGKYNLIVPETQIRLILESATQTEIQLESLKEELQLEAALRGTSSQKYRDLMEQRKLLSRTLSNRLRSRPDSNTLLLPANILPNLAAEYFRIERGYAVKLAVYKYLVQQVEALRLDANKSIRVISLLDRPWVNEKRVSPKRRIIVQAVFILSLLLSIIIAVTHSFWESQSRDNENLRRTIADIRKVALRNR